MPTKVNTKILDLLCMLPIAILLLIIYKDNVGNLSEDFADELAQIEMTRSTFYIYPFTGVLRPTKYAFQDLIFSLFNKNIAFYHIIFLCLHLIDSFFVFVIAKKIIGNRLVGFLAALLFATSWLHSETVLWCQADLFTAFFGMCSLILFYKNRLNPTWSSYLSSLSAFVIAIGAREPAVIFLPILLFLTDRYITLEFEDTSPEVSLHLSKKAYLPFLFISLPWLSFLIHFYYLGIFVAPGDPVNASIITRLLRTSDNLLHSVTFCFAFPLFSESPRWGIINLILVMFFYFFSPAWIKRRLLLLMIAMVIVYLPTSRMLSPAPRYLYLSSVFGMTIFVTMLYYGGIQLSERVKVSESLAKLLLVFYVLLLVYGQLSFVNRQMEYYKRVSNVARNLVKAVTTIFPENTLGIHLVFVNFSYDLEPKPPIYWPIWRSSLSRRSPLSMYYGSSKVGQVTEVILSEVYGGRGTLLGRKISIQEFEELTKDKGNTVYFFNSKDDSIHNVTGKDYNFLKKLASGS